MDYLFKKTKGWTDALGKTLLGRTQLRNNSNKTLIDNAKEAVVWINSNLLGSEIVDDTLGSFTMQKMVGKHVNMLKNRSIGLFKSKNKVLERKISETKFPANTDILTQGLCLEVKNLSFRHFTKVLGQI